MRELRVVGLAPDAKHIICVDTESGQKFRLPADEKLRAATRGDLARLGQIEIEMESTLRPREIQARIRAGASVEQVAAESGMSAVKVEKFAYPVLLERSRAADLAQQGHPLLPNGPSVQTLAEVITTAFRERGHDLETATWDAWKDDAGHWIAQLQWTAGRSVISAHWRFQPDAHGGSLTALDDPANALIDPDFGRPLRGLASIPDTPKATAEAPATDPREQPTLDYGESVQPAIHPEPEPNAAPERAGSGTRDKRGKPPVPSWEDVLLGVRSSGN
ncbi:septation protein SepH [Skermania piniformis]|uniref:DUF3071 domain-containing protein n=1 Tax=Skermania pinensis TaxID=39122 RepID=A0ABX8S6B5_9ACTN|nr:septation protein SepH [Skermania piniformis]QXQ13388.1 DUF3071 domain-containing protein [Skermania piniformis]